MMKWLDMDMELERGWGLHIYQESLARRSPYTGTFGGDGDYDILRFGQYSVVLQLPISSQHSPESALPANSTTGGWARTTVGGPARYQDTTQDQST